MISFLNDYNEVGHKKILDDLYKIIDNKYIGYSGDELVSESNKLIKKALGDEDIEIHYVHGGTIANILSLLISLERYESIISCNTGHIINHENGSIEALGLQIISIPNKEGKVTTEEIEKVLVKHSAEYTTKPKIVYLSNATELGTIYTKKELEKLRKYCDEKNLYIFCDGARLAVATMSSKSDIRFDEYTKYFDVFTIGGTKNGFLFGEAIIIKNKELQNSFARMLIKQRGALLAKGFLYGSQFITMFKDGLYFELAKKACENAKKIGEILEKYGFEVINGVQSNLVFTILPKNVNEILKENFLYDNNANEKGEIEVRFVATWNTHEEELKALDLALKNIVQQ